MSEIPSSHNQDEIAGWQDVVDTMHTWHPDLQAHARRINDERGLPFDLSQHQAQGGLQNQVNTVEIERSRHEVGLLTASEYKARRSETLDHNPEAELNEQQEIYDYFKRQDPHYTEEIQKLADLEHSASPDCRAVVIIPAYNEGSRIRQTLEQYVKQNIDPKMFEIVVFATPVEDDSTPAEIERFKLEHPELSVVFAAKPWDDGEPATVGNGRKYAADIAMARLLARDLANQDTVLVANDADTLNIEEDYLNKILAEFDANKTRSALVTELDIPPSASKKPNVAAAFYLLSKFEEIYATGKVADDKDIIPEPALTNGRSTAIRTADYAAIGGYNPGAVISEDWELGWMLADARDWNAERIGFFKDTKLTTDPRRFIDTVINRVPTDQQLLGFKDKPELRQLNNDEILAMVPDTFDLELFQDDVDSIWNSQFTGANKRIPETRFRKIFDATMHSLGVEYVLDDAKHIVITNVSGFLEKISEGTTSIEIVHSEPRVYTPEMVNEIREYFSGVPVGVIESRNQKADEISQVLQIAYANNEAGRVSELQKELKRFRD